METQADLLQSLSLLKNHIGSRVNIYSDPTMAAAFDDETRALSEACDTIHDHVLHQVPPVVEEVVPSSVWCRDMHELAHLVGSIYFAGGFKAETKNECDLEELLVKRGYRYISWDEVGEAAQRIEESRPWEPSNLNLSETPTTVKVHLPREAADYINRVAGYAGAHPDEVASIMFAMASVREGIDRYHPVPEGGAQASAVGEPKEVSGEHES